MIYLAYKKKDRIAVFLLIGYLAQYLPWFFVTRITFIYHYFPSVAFVVMMITYSLQLLKNRMSSGKFLLLLGFYSAAVFGLFLLFYPVLSGQPVSTEYVDHWLRWLNSWVLLAP
jgi:dolichyl-phosphate-mannose--protein O-mannosyl transferase